MSLIDVRGLAEALAGLPREALEPLAAAILSAADAPADPRPDGQWMTAAEAAEHLRTTSKAIYNRVSAGQLTRHGPRGRLLLDRGEVERLAAGGRRVGR